VTTAEGASSEGGKGVSFGIMTIFLVGEYFWRREEKFERAKIRKRAKCECPLEHRMPPT
jgi:hypothetical protein